MTRSWAEVPLSLYSIPVVWVLAMVPHAQKNIMAASLAPRGTVQRVQGDKELDTELAQRIARYEGAHQNGMEVFPLWSVAVAVGNICQVGNQTLNICSVLFVTLRIIYNYIYANQRTRAQAATRSLTWWAGIVVSMFLIIRGAVAQT
ncbi:hypothetical protein BKA62DRAFT_772922 [Auriculariales sp. MPI-PUGE-AT-0066]|nr:hypothetical protein BKA62DRAFT_772922 [Auriculariales sp. MPI-PUGE-AT-0066]